MTISDKAQIVLRLVNEYGYRSAIAEQVAEKLANLQPALAEAAQSWWTTGFPITLSVREYTVERLKKEHGLNDVAALLTLDWLSRDPQNAERALCQGFYTIR